MLALKRTGTCTYQYHRYISIPALCFLSHDWHEKTSGFSLDIY